MWAHHLYVTGSVYLPFALMTMLIAVPTGVKFFNWIGTMWRGSISFLETPMLFTIGFLATFLFGGLTGVILASPRWTSMSPTRTSWWRTSTTPSSAPLSSLMFAAYYFWWPVDRAETEREARQMALLVPVHRVPGHLPVPALAQGPGDAAPVRRLPRVGRLRDAQSHLDRRLRDLLGISTIIFIYNVLWTWRGPHGRRR